MDFLNTSRNRAVLRFAGWYGLSLVLLLIVAVAFWRNIATTMQAAQDTRFETEASYVQADVELHKSLYSLETAYAQYFSQKSEAAATAVRAAKTSFSATLDNLRKQAQLQGDEATRKGLEELAGRYDNSFKLKTALFGAFEQTGSKDTATTVAASAPTAATTADVQALRAQLAEKDRIIAALQSGGSSNSATTTGDGDEWKKKYNALKTSHDKAVAGEQQLKAAYQTIVKDNQRLVQQLQALKKG